ncbi:MAG: stage II sporulation protein M [Candidatus Woesearchaeota archaeon]|nr:stage II sporulation protein M [Candidatus Woesearchaeota archaeon]
MVLENILTAFQAEQKPWETVFLGFIYTTVAVFLAYMVFKSYASMTMVFLLTMAALPLMYQMTIMEEEKDLEGYPELWLLKEHSKALSSMMWMFIGMCIAFMIWYAFLPSEMSSTLFSAQRETINAINGKATGLVSADFSIFTKIFLNNIRVLVFCILFSFLFGAGAIFILAWNASIIGAAMGNLVRTGLAELADATGLALAAGYFQVISYALLRYVIHGIPEIGAYFVAGLAGGIVSIAVMKHDIATRKFEHVLLDSADLLLIALFLTLFAAILEVWVTPVVMGFA